MNKHKEPLVTVIIPSYNHEKYIADCLKSVIRQTYRNIQIIVIDDGSKDKSPEIITELAKNHHFQYEIQQNKGVSKTLNMAISKYAEGKYIISLASDDYLPVDSIALRVEFMEAHQDFEMAYGRTIWVDDSSKIVKKNDCTLFRSGYIFDDLFLGKYWIPTPTNIIRKEAFKIVGLYDENLVLEDYYMWLKISSKFQIGFIDDYLTYYRVHDSNFHKNLELLLDQQAIIYREYRNHKLYKKALNNWNYRCFISLSTRNKKRALKHMIKAINHGYKRGYIRNSLKLLIK